MLIPGIFNAVSSKCLVISYKIGKKIVGSILTELIEEYISFLSFSRLYLDNSI
jgi:hypothetical protein